MRNIVLSLSILAFAISASAQDAVDAYANGDDTYLLFSDKGFDPQKKYTLFNFWNPKTPHVDIHSTQFNTIKQNFSGYENVEFVNVQWEDEKDIQAVLNKHHIESTVRKGKFIRLKGDKFTMNTTSPNAFLLLEDSNAAFLCSGSICGKKVTQFFSSEARQ